MHVYAAEVRNQPTLTLWSKPNDQFHHKLKQNTAIIREMYGGVIPQVGNYLVSNYLHLLLLTI